MTQDQRLEIKAIRERWPVDPVYRDAIIKRLLRIIADPASSNRDVINATRAVLTAESQNQHDEHQLLQKKIGGDIAAALQLVIDAVPETHKEAIALAVDVALGEQNESGS